MPPITVTVVQVCFVINCSGEVNWGQIALSVKTNSLSLALFFFFLCSWSGYTWRDRQSPPAAPLRSSAIISWSWESDNHCLEDNPQNSSSKCYFRLVRVFEYQKFFFFFFTIFTLAKTGGNYTYVAQGQRRREQCVIFVRTDLNTAFYLKYWNGGIVKLNGRSDLSTLFQKYTHTTVEKSTFIDLISIGKSEYSVNIWLLFSCCKLKPQNTWPTQWDSCHINIYILNVMLGHRN